MELRTELEKKFQGRRAQRTKKGYFSTLAYGSMIVKTTVKIAIIPKGLRRDQAKPKIECL